MENFDLLYTRLNDMGVTQQELKSQIQLNNTKVDQCTKEQKSIAQQVQANGQAVAQLTLRQFEDEVQSDSTGSESPIEDANEEGLLNVFAKPKVSTKAEHSRAHQYKSDHHKHDSMPHHALPKMHFLKFYSTQRKIWIDNSTNYFAIYYVPSSVWLSSASMHLEENAAKWWQAYKQQHKKSLGCDFVRL